MILDIDILLIARLELIQDFNIPEKAVERGLERNRKGSSSWKHKKDDNGLVVIYYDSIPETTKAKLPSKEILIAKAKAEQAIVSVKDAENAVNELKELHRSKYLLQSDCQYFLMQESINETKAMQLAESAAWLSLLVDYKCSKDTKTIGFASKKALREEVIKVLEDKPLYGLKTSSIEYLRNKETEWKQALDQQDYSLPKHKRELEARRQGLDLLISKKINSSNRRIIGKATGDATLTIAKGTIDLHEFHARTIMSLAMNYGKANKLSIHEICEDYRWKCTKSGEEPAGDRAIYNFLARQDVKQIITWERDGYTNWEQFAPQVRRQKAQYSLSKFSIDGFSVDFYTNTKTELGNARVMLQVVAIFDTASEAITGYDIGITEDGKMARNAIRNHLNIWDGRWYFEAESDGGSAFYAKDTREIVDKLTLYRTRSISADITKKNKSNPKSRKAERFLQEVNRLSARIDGWKGTNITSHDISRKPNEDYNTVQESIEHGINMVIELIEVYNNQKLEKFGQRSRLEHFQAIMHPNAEVYTPEIRASLLNQWTKKQLLGDEIEITVNRKVYRYEFPDYIDHLHLLGKKREVKISYDETDMSSVHIFGFTKDEPYIGEIKLMKLVQEAKIEQTHADEVVLGSRWRKLDKVQKDTRRKSLEIIAADQGIHLPSNATIEEMEAIVRGAKLQATRTFEERYETERSANTTVKNYYQDRILRNEGMKVPLKTAQTSEEKKAEAMKKRYAS